MKESQKKYICQYSRKNLLHVGFFLNKKTEQDLIEKITSQPNKMGYIKSLIRKDMENDKH